MRRTVYTGDGRPIDESQDVRDRMWLDTEPANRDDWMTWLRRHGIEPNDVIVHACGQTGWIERQEGLYRVSWLASVRDQRGWFTKDLRERYVQLEGKPLPFPALSFAAGVLEDVR